MVRAAVVIPASQAALGGRLWFYTASGSGRGTLNVYDMAQGSCLVCCCPRWIPFLPLQHLRCLRSFEQQHPSESSYAKLQSLRACHYSGVLMQRQLVAWLSAHQQVRLQAK